MDLSGLGLGEGRGLELLYGHVGVFWAEIVRGISGLIWSLKLVDA